MSILLLEESYSNLHKSTKARTAPRDFNYSGIHHFASVQSHTVEHVVGSQTSHEVLQGALLSQEAKREHAPPFADSISILFKFAMVLLLKDSLPFNFFGFMVLILLLKNTFQFCTLFSYYLFTKFLKKIK
jgi:hypothetical protein